MATKDRLPVVTLEDVTIMRGAWRNFAGEAGQYNREGVRTFNVILPADVALAMRSDGFNVKDLPPREEEDEMGYRLEVTVSYKIRPPQIYFISGGQRTLLDQGSVEILDYADIAKADIMINPSQWDVNGNTGIKAYLHKAFITVAEDDLDRKYSDIPVTHNSHVNESAVFFEED